MNLKNCQKFRNIKHLKGKENRLIVCLNIPEKSFRRIFARQFAECEGDPRRLAMPRFFSQAPRQASKFEKDRKQKNRVFKLEQRDGVWGFRKMWVRV